MTLTLATPIATASSPSTTRAAGCPHCGGPVRVGETYCCPGCAGAHALVRQLGLDTYYRSRPDRVDAPVIDALPADPTPYVVADGERCDLDLAVGGLHCAACVWLIENALARDPDVLGARLNATLRRLHLSWRGPAARAAEFAELLRRLGYRVAPFVPGAAARLADDEERFLLRCMAVAGFAAANVMLLSLSVWAGVWSGADGMGSATRDLLHLISAAIALPAALYASRPFLRSALGALSHGRANMDVPIVIGITLTLAISLAETMASGRHAYFESALMLLFFLLVGRYVERRARGRARSAAAHLLSLAGSVATVEGADGVLRAAAPAQLRPGDVLRVATGERLVADAVLIAGETQIDNAVVSGESVPARVAAGALMHAGAVNLGPPLRARVAAAGDDTMLARVVRLLEAAEQGRGRYVALADRVARWYAPAVHAAAALAFLAWYVVLDASLREALLIAVAVLIVTCPCALALAQPAVATAVVGRLARHGILVVSPTALERLGAVDTVVFDKTGTLTMGRPTLRPDPQRPAEALDMAAAIAANSRHPLARALAAAAPSETPADEVTEHPGLGLSWRDVRLGSRRFCGLPDDGDDDAAELWLARPGLPPVRFAFSDSLRPGARQTVAKLRHRGLKVVLLSGDRASAVADVAAETGIDDWSAGLTPEAKLQRIGALSAAGRRVLMVGDGINDAPSLAAAHASMSPGDATDVASAAADALFRGPSLDGVAVALDAAQGAIGRMRANLAIALVYNLIAVPVAMLGLLTPPIAAAAMSASSLLVVLNAVRLGRDRASPESAGRRA